MLVKAACPILISLKLFKSRKSRMKPQAEIPETRRLSFFADQAVSTARSVQTRE